MLIEEITAPTYGYHGTTAYFTNFKVDDDEYMIDRALGVHFSADPGVANSFIENRINGRLDGMKEGGRIIRVRIPDQDQLLQVPQEQYENGNYKTDQYAVEQFAANVAYRLEPDMLARYLIQARKVEPDLATSIAHKLASGEYAAIPGDREYTLAAFLSNYGGRPFNPEDKTRMVRLARQYWRRQGYLGLRYINTSPMEMATASDPTSYIIFPDESGRLPVEVEG